MLLNHSFGEVRRVSLRLEEQDTVKYQHEKSDPHVSPDGQLDWPHTLDIAARKVMFMSSISEIC